MQGPFRHYVLNVLWIFINVLCVCLTMYHLYKLYKDLSQSNLVSLMKLVTCPSFLYFRTITWYLRKGFLIDSLCRRRSAWRRWCRR